ncbi:MAG: S41 family peptidase [Pseudomonadota bacterium]
MLAALALAGAQGAGQASRAEDDTWAQIEEVLSGVTAIYYTPPDVDGMLRGALVAMVQQVPRADFDASSHRERYRIRVGRQTVASLPHPTELDEVMVGILKAADALHGATRVPRERLVESALRGAVQGMGNCYTVYLTRDMVQRLSYEPDQTPADVGIALECGQEGMVRHVRPGSPAYVGGIERGDRVRSVDGKPCRGMDAAEIYALLSGPCGSRTRVGVTRRSGVDLTVDLMREERPAARPWVRELAQGKVLYVRPGPMTAHTTQELAPHLACDRRQGVVLDLRGNEGGRVDEAENFAGLFLEPGPVAHLEGRGQRDLGHLVVKAAGPCSHVPLVVLVDHDTASAAELIAQALRERRGAALLGQTTFGKGSVQQFLRFSDGAVAKVTTARYLSPSGKPLDHPLDPDVVLSDSGVALGPTSDPMVDPLVRLASERLLVLGPGAPTAQGK